MNPINLLVKQPFALNTCLNNQKLWQQLVAGNLQHDLVHQQSGVISRSVDLIGWHKYHPVFLVGWIM